MSRPRPAAAPLLAVLALATAACGGGGSAGDGTATAPTVPPRPALAVEVRSETFIDASRPTDAHGRAPAAPARTLRTTVLHPAAGQAGGPFPLVVFGHGAGGFGERYPAASPPT